MTRRRCVIAAGGTGGHFYPGLVLARELRARGWEALMLVRRQDPALRTLEAESIPAVEVDLSGLPRRPSLELFRFLGRLARSLRLVDRVIGDFKPAAVVGMGGYLTFPAAAAAARRGVPRAVHESNAVLGLANRACVKLGARLFWGLPPRELKGGSLVGTPIRPALWERAPAQAARAALGLDDLPTLLVFGGSQGARGLNEGAAAAVKASGWPQVLHLSGPKDAEAVSARYRDAGVSAKVLAYLDGMESAYAAADAVVCRSGASTLAELAAQRKPAVLVPFPFAAEGHQEANARVLEARGACAVVLEKDLGSRLAGVLGDLLSSESRRRGMSEAYQLLGLPEPSQTPARLADAVEALANRE